MVDHKMEVLVAEMGEVVNVVKMVIHYYVKTRQI